MDDLSKPDPASMPRGIYPIDNEPGALGYWDGRDWFGGPVASIGARCWGNALDVVLASILFFVLFLLFAIPVPTTDGPDPVANPSGMTIAFFAALLLGFVGYFVLSYRLWGRTIGMQAAGTYIIHLPSGQEKLPWGPALIRALVLSAGYFCGLLWLIWLLITATSKTKQGPHDVAAKTAVLSSRVPSAAPRQPAAEAEGQSDRFGTHVAPNALVHGDPVAPPESADLSIPLARPGYTEIPAPSDPLPDANSSRDANPAMIFISHASEDGETAQGLAAALEAQGLNTWLASRDVSIGANYAAEIFQNLVNSDYLLVVLSPNSIESAHVRREVSIAIDRKVPVLPVSTDPTGELMANLPEDWQYWLNIAQVFRMTDEDSTAIEIARRVK